MMWTFSLSFIALCLGGVPEQVGYLKVLIKGIMNKVKSIGGLVILSIILSCMGIFVLWENKDSINTQMQIANE